MDTRLIFFVLLSLLSFSLAQAKGKRIAKFKPCKVRSIELTRDIKGCGRVRMKVNGCSGYCKSETRSDTVSLGLIPNCQCCMPNGDFQTVKKVLYCHNGKRPMIIKMPSAKSCSCRKCGGHLRR